MDWLELSVEVDPEAVEPVSELFARLGYNGGVVVEQAAPEIQAEQNSWDELQYMEIDPTRVAAVSAQRIVSSVPPVSVNSWLTPRTPGSAAR